MMLWIEQLKFLNYFFVVIICIYGKTKFQFVFGKESKWQKQVGFGHF